MGQPYEATIAVSGNEAAVVKGVAESAGEVEFTVRAYCYGTTISGQTGEQRYELLVKQD